MVRLRKVRRERSHRDYGSNRAGTCVKAPVTTAFSVALIPVTLFDLPTTVEEWIECGFPGRPKAIHRPAEKNDWRIGFRRAPARQAESNTETAFDTVLLSACVVEGGVRGVLDRGCDGVRFGRSGMVEGWLKLWQ